MKLWRGYLDNHIFYKDDYYPEGKAEKGIIFEVVFLKLDGETILSTSVNQYYQEKLEEYQKQMEKIKEQQIKQYQELGKVDNYLIRYGMKVTTLCSFRWGNFFNVINKESWMYNRAIIDNFNISTGEKYSLENIFCVEKEVYEERLLEELEKDLKLKREYYIGKKEILLDFTEFMITPNKLLIVYDINSYLPAFIEKNLLLEVRWSSILDILEENFAKDILNYCN